MSELKPCPFCGGEAKISPVEYMGKNGVIPICRKCAAMIKPWFPFESSEQAVIAWNIRTDGELRESEEV